MWKINFIKRFFHSVVTGPSFHQENSSQLTSPSTTNPMSPPAQLDPVTDPLALSSSPEHHT